MKFLPDQLSVTVGGTRFVRRATLVRRGGGYVQVYFRLNRKLRAVDGRTIAATMTVGKSSMASDDMARLGGSAPDRFCYVQTIKPVHGRLEPSRSARPGTVEDVVLHAHDGVDIHFKGVYVGPLEDDLQATRLGLVHDSDGPPSRMLGCPPGRLAP